MPKPSTRIAIMAKGRHVAAIAIDVNTSSSDGVLHAVGMIDPRCSPARDLRSFETAAAACAQFCCLLAMSRDNGWPVAHYGVRNFG